MLGDLSETLKFLNENGWVRFLPLVNYFLYRLIVGLLFLLLLTFFLDLLFNYIFLFFFILGFIVQSNSW
jgi:hypothetical protein